MIKKETFNSLISCALMETTFFLDYRPSHLFVKFQVITLQFDTLTSVTIIYWIYSSGCQKQEATKRGPTHATR